MVTKNKCARSGYIDRDGDGYSSVIAHLDAFNFDPGYPYIISRLGPDCDDSLTTGKDVNQYNSCGICAAEPLNGVCDGDPCAVKVNFGSNVNINSINECSLQLLKKITDKLGIDKFEITSALRLGADQARAMFNNIQLFGVSSQKALYGSSGDRVIDAYSDALAAGESDDGIKQAMLDKINELGPHNVSNHCGNPSMLTVVDIRPSSIPLSNRSEFVNAINEAILDGIISKFLHPGNSKDPAYHIEIDVKNCNLINCN